MINPISEKYLELINTKYKWAKELKVSRYSVEWGKWSREMNLELRELLKNEEHKELEALKAVYSAWVCFSELLEINFKYPKWFKRKRRKEAVQVIMYLTEFIKTGTYPDGFKGKYRTINPNDFPLEDNELAKGDN